MTTTLLDRFAALLRTIAPPAPKPRSFKDAGEELDHLTASTPRLLSAEQQNEAWQLLYKYERLQSAPDGAKWHTYHHPQIRKGTLPWDSREPATEDGPNRLSVIHESTDTHLGIELPAEMTPHQVRAVAEALLLVLDTMKPTGEQFQDLTGRERLEFIPVRGLCPRCAHPLGSEACETEHRLAEG